MPEIPAFLHFNQKQTPLRKYPDYGRNCLDFCSLCAYPIYVLDTHQVWVLLKKKFYQWPHPEAVKTQASIVAELLASPDHNGDHLAKEADL